MNFKSGSPRSPHKTSSTSALGSMPLRSKSALEVAEAMDLLPSMPTPLPPLRDGVTEAHYSRWVVEETNKETGDHLREESLAQKSYRKSQLERFLTDQHRKVEDSHHQMASASAAVETVRLKNLETGQEMRLHLLELKQSIQLEKQVWSAKGRELVEHAKHVQSSKVLEQQLEQRTKRQSIGTELKKQREQLGKAREEQIQADQERKQAATARVKAETAKESIGVSSELVMKEKQRIGRSCRDLREANIAARQAAKSRFASSSQVQCQAVQASTSNLILTPTKPNPNRCSGRRCKRASQALSLHARGLRTTAGSRRRWFVRRGSQRRSAKRNGRGSWRHRTRRCTISSTPLTHTYTPYFLLPTSHTPHYAYMAGARPPLCLQVRPA